MDLNINNTIGKIRTAIDDMKGTLDDDFATDVDEELKQALRHGVESLLMEAPVTLLDVSVITEGSSAPGYSRETGSMGDGIIVLPKDFLRFLDLKVEGWRGILYDLMDAGSEEEYRQRSPWSRGTNTKPKAMLDTDDNGSRVVRYWPGSADKELERLTYVPMWTEDNGNITCALRPEAEKNIIYRTASIFLEGKKEGELAERFKGLSTM